MHASSPQWLPPRLSSMSSLCSLPFLTQANVQGYKLEELHPNGGGGGGGEGGGNPSLPPKLMIFW